MTSEYQLTDGMMRVDVKDLSFQFTVTVNAAIAIVDKCGSVLEASKKINEYDPRTCLDVWEVAIGRVLNEIERNIIYQEIGLIGLSAHAMTYLGLLLSGGKQETLEQEKKQGKSKAKP